jgi:RimJ/RimL family protein N-acetyltransferase
VSVELRDLVPDDLPLYEALNAPEMMEHLGGPSPTAWLAEKFRRDVEDVAADRVWILVVRPEGADGPVAGTVSIWDHELEGEAVTEIGWMVLPPFQGRGIGSAAVRAAIDRAAASGRWRALHAYPPVTNARSNAMCRKMGFALLGEEDFTFRGRDLRCNRWRLDLADWTPTPRG